MLAYHDKEWCVPTKNDQYLFELLCLEGAQAGLSWSIVLAKREAYQEAFKKFDITYCAKLTDQQLEEIRVNSGVIKNSAKLKAIRSNAQAVLALKTEYNSFVDFLWQYVDGKQIINCWEDESQVPAETELSKQLSKDLKKRGFKFVGPVIIYSFMQAVGMIDDHIISCPFHTSNR
ncbi:DNA-3-methyladenine glycosylase I [Amphibacillus marinus]|uniref:DNA-3-methyladenine glycosylase I n=2 Tax=Amphibacillus marinus TaxID=872970 RepID=A0A1H8KDC0_9BACI|nr:DNA-3-methyladenine glycosylase I [Amphibacillus marinus]